MNKALFNLFLLISLVFFSCSNSKQLTNCTSFKKNKPAKSWVKLRKSKNHKKADSKKITAAKKTKQKSKIVDRLTNSFVEKIAKPKNYSAKLNTLSKKQLYVLLKEFTNEDPSNVSQVITDELLKDSKIENTPIYNPKYKSEKLGNDKIAFNFNKRQSKFNYKNTYSISWKKPKQNTSKKQLRLNKKKIHGLAIAAFICAITGLGLFAVIFGAFAVDRIEEEPEKYRGKTLAIIASILGLIGVILAIGIFGLAVSAP